MLKSAAAGTLLFVLCGYGAKAHADERYSNSPSCQQSLWGCPGRANGDSSGPPAVRYERVLSSARRVINYMRANAPTELDAAAHSLEEAARLLPEAPDAYSLLGQVQLERGQLEAAATALRHAQELYEADSSDDTSSASIERADPQLALALGLLAAMEGDLSSALARYLRLLRHSAPTHRLLYRTADVLMAMGRLDEATALYSRACALPRGMDMPSIDIARSCHGYLVALDRGEKAGAAQALRRLRMLDGEQRVLRLGDFVQPYERDYYRALILPPSCERLEALNRYLHAAAGSAPLSYLHRAERHQRVLSALGCPTPPSL